LNCIGPGTTAFNVATFATGEFSGGEEKKTKIPKKIKKLN